MRRFRIRQKEWLQVRDYLKKEAHQGQDDDDEKAAEAPEPKAMRVPVLLLPKIGWAHKAELKLQKGPHGKEIVFARESGTSAGSSISPPTSVGSRRSASERSEQVAGQWKRVLHDKEVDGYLRDALLNPDSVVPMSRDAGYHIVQKNTFGCSRRRFMQFLKKQEVVQLTRDRMPEQKKPGHKLQGKGYLELDLVEAKGRDIGKWVHHPVKNFYWITLIDRLTGWLEVERILHKDVKTVAPKLTGMLGKMRRALKVPVRYIRSDKGSEFKKDTQAVFVKLGIKHRFVSSGNRIEKVNRDYQRAWYRLMRLGRGDLRELDVQAQAIVNNTKSQITGFTPLEAVEQDEATLVHTFNSSRKKVPKYKAESIWDEDKPDGQRGARVRYLITTVVGKHGPGLGYKTYRGKHWSAEIFDVVNYNKDINQYYVAGRNRFRDQLLKVPDVDEETNARVNARHRKQKKDWGDKIGPELVPE